MKIKITIGFLLSLFLAYATRGYIGNWLEIHYEYTVPFFGPQNPAELEAFLYGYIFFSSFLTSVLSNKIKLGLFFALPVVVLMLSFKSLDPNLWLSLLLLAAGLGLAWIALLIKKKIIAGS